VHSLNAAFNTSKRGDLIGLIIPFILAGWLVKRVPANKSWKYFSSDASLCPSHTSFTANKTERIQMAENGEMAKAYYISISISIQHTKHDEQGKNSDVKAKPRRTDTFGPTHTHTSRDGMVGLKV